MIKIADAFKNGKAFIPFFTCGDPDLETTAALVRAAQTAGADLIELGIPFSDPTAEGPVIQAASTRALAAGTTTDRVFELVRDLRRDVTAPLVFMTYANLVYSYGTERFLARSAEVGVQGLILPDVPFEEKAEFAPACRAHGLELISLIAPTSEARIGRIAREAEGFVYCVSSLGVTGVRAEITTDIGAMVGVSTPAQARQMAQQADGVIVGSAIMRLVAAHGRDSVPVVAEYIRSIKAAVIDN